MAMLKQTPGIIIVSIFAALFAMAAFVYAQSYGNGSGQVQGGLAGAQAQYASSNLSDTLNNITIGTDTPYSSLHGYKVYTLGNAPAPDYSKIVSPCSSQAGADVEYTNGIYNCQYSGASDQVAGTSRGISAQAQVESLNWAGYVGVSSAHVTTSAQGSWEVQAAGKTSGATYSAQWVGIGGYSDDTLIQTGTESDYYDGSSHYTAWYELLPASETAIAGLTISPGDIINATIKAVPGETNEWNITLIDETTGKGFDIVVSYSSSQLSSEWVEERPEICSYSCSLTTLADFNTAYYGEDNTGIPNTNFADMGSNTVPISGLPGLTSVTMVSQSGSKLTMLAQPSALRSDGTSFTVSTPAPVTTTTTVRTTTIPPTTTIRPMFGIG